MNWAVAQLAQIYIHTQILCGPVSFYCSSKMNRKGENNNNFTRFVNSEVCGHLEPMWLIALSCPFCGHQNSATSRTISQISTPTTDITLPTF